MLFGIMLSITNVTLGVDRAAAQKRLRKLDRLVAIEIDGGTDDKENQSQDRDQHRPRASSAWRPVRPRAFRTGAHLLREKWRTFPACAGPSLCRDMR